MLVKTLAERLPHMPTNKRHQLAQRATTWVEDKCGKAYEGAQALGDIATFERRLYADRRIYVGALHWEPHDGQWLMRGFDGADEVAGIEYTATHTANRKNVFQLTVLGQRTPVMFHHVEEARNMAADIYSDLKKDT
ncbi:hypothetical protein KBW81_12920 [Loktanella salsilacus]|uniref:hypothetical protein n=1 Tax=Loktanella salsilacus TaxID=195913 RepID=UPI0020B66174|nr:hypothetical protein [Loktanella salsilacus]UTH47607.1 hypothetical protein KBW81_12920 [Loktanella salsilacus]